MQDSPYRGIHERLARHPLLRASRAAAAPSGISRNSNVSSIAPPQHDAPPPQQQAPPTPSLTTQAGAVAAAASSPQRTLLPLDKSVFSETLKFRIAGGDYMASKQLCLEQEAAIIAAKSQYQSALCEAQQTESQKLQEARRIALTRARQKYEEELHALQDKFEAKQAEAQLVHDEKLALYESLQWQRALAKPVVLSTATNSIRQSEAHLAKLHQFDEAAAAQTLFDKRERHERHRMEIERHRKLTALIVTKRQQFLEEERTYMGKLKNELLVAKQRAAEELRRIEATYAHLEHDMKHAHGRQRLMSAKCGTRQPTTAAAASTSLSSSSLPTTPVPTTQTAPQVLLENFDNGHRAQRGSMMLRRLQGDRFVIPSLCEMYGNS